MPSTGSTLTPGRGLLAVLLLIVTAGAVRAHPAPFSYFDIAVYDDRLDVSLVAHDLDLAQAVSLARPDALLDPAVAEAQGPALLRILQSRFHIESRGVALACAPQPGVEVLAERQSLRFRYACPSARIGEFTIRAWMFPYDPTHQTFVNVREGESLVVQAILDKDHRELQHFTGSRQGTWAVVRHFVPAGVHHILIGPDHLLFLVGLLLLGGSLRKLLLVVTAFTASHSVTLSLAALNLVTPPAFVIEPAIALSIVYVGIDNLMVRDRPARDMRAWIAFGFGLVHGFGFANVLREMDLPPRALGWSLFSFNVGVEIGQALVVVVVAAALAALRRRSESVGRALVLVGSIVVIAAGTFWFVERVFLTGGPS